MHLSGQTPLFRAKNLEKHLNCQGIYLKLEGANPTGHKNDRIADAHLKNAVNRKDHTIIIHGTENYLRSLIYFAEIYGVQVKVATSDKRLKKKLEREDLEIIPIKGKETFEQLDELKELADQEGVGFLTEWERQPFIRTFALQEIMAEVILKQPNMDAVWTHYRGGYTLRGIYHELVRSWLKGRITKLPEIVCGLSPDTLASQSLVQETNATLEVITKDQLREAQKLIRRLENISLSQEEAYPLAAFIKAKPSRGNHIIILSDAKSDLELKAIGPDHESYGVNELVKLVRDLLVPYEDSVEETSDAVKTALEKGFVYLAEKKGEVSGVLIVVPTSFQDFIPRYHLAYIGVRPGSAGRGVATDLINKAVELSQGSLSLHVDKPNQRAKKLYEKMGFHHAYDRMIYGWSEEASEEKEKES